MYKKSLYTVVYNRQLASKTWEMRLAGDTGYITAPGQFVNLALEGRFLRRPISVCDYDSESITLLYDVVGEGTAQMARMRTGHTVDMLTGLGNGFDTSLSGRHPLLVGGGIGVAPLLRLAKDLLAAGHKPVAILGFNKAADVVLDTQFASLGIDTLVSTADGSRGCKGFVTDVARELAGAYDYYYTCGPTPMLRAVWEQLPADGQLSLDERMGCGFGACMCCSIETTRGSRRVCKEGPVFVKNELIWK